MNRTDIRWRMFWTNAEFWIVVVCFAVWLSLLIWRGDA